MTTIKVNNNIGGRLLAIDKHRVGGNEIARSKTIYTSPETSIYKAVTSTFSRKDNHEPFSAGCVVV
jgi:hypothetical protein